MLSLLYLIVKAQQYFVTLSCMFLDKKTVLEISLNPWLNLTIFQGTWPWQVQPSPAGYKENDRLKAAAGPPGWRFDVGQTPHPRKQELVTKTVQIYQINNMTLNNSTLTASLLCCFRPSYIFFYFVGLST